MKLLGQWYHITLIGSLCYSSVQLGAPMIEVAASNEQYGSNGKLDRQSLWAEAIVSLSSVAFAIHQSNLVLLSTRIWSGVEDARDRSTFQQSQLCTTNYFWLV
jgi:hypothetical protein